jgi:protein SCO1
VAGGEHEQAVRPTRVLARAGSVLRELVSRPLAWVALIAALAAWPVVWSVRTRLPPPPPVLGSVPEFRLTDQDGNPFGSRELAGRIWVASVVSTRGDHGGMRQMARIQARARNLEPALHLVSVSVDPEYDTPDRLRAYARAHRASPRMWTFLTGPPAVVRATVQEALRVSAGEHSPSEVGRLVLVDGAARIRGAYEADAPGAADRVVRDAALLVNRR